MEVTPKRTAVNGNPNGDWGQAIWNLWFEAVSPRFKAGQWCSSANYYLGEKEGFTYVVEPGRNVCYWNRRAA